MRTPNKDGKYKVMYVKQANGSYTTRCTLPDYMLRDLGIQPNNPYIKLTRVENGILITKGEYHEISENNIATS